MQLKAITKFTLACLVTLWAVALSDVTLLAAILGMELLLLIGCRKLVSSIKLLATLAMFSLLLAGLQLLCGSSYEAAAVSALRMLTMTVIFVYLLSTTASHEFQQLFTQYFHLPAEYAFMLTSVFRFIPDFIRDSQEVREAQACRGYRASGHGIGRLVSYAALIGPLVLRAVSRSENMAMALALRGFAPKTLQGKVPLTKSDYGCFTGMAAITVVLVYCKVQQAGLF